MQTYARRATSFATAGSLLIMLHGVALADGGLKPLKEQPVTLPSNLSTFVIDKAAAIRLGKAFFWESQTGGDGKVACASCHFQGGADIRTTNTVNPGANGIFQTALPGGTVSAASFPITNGDVLGSQGVFKRNFIGLALPSAADYCSPVDTSGPFGNNRQVTGRNTPFAVNAIFNFRSFWDGRANNVFNGVNPAGPTDPSARVLQIIGGVPTPVSIGLRNASLASQAVGPPNNGVEMSCAGRNFPTLGRKLLALRPLGQQLVSPTDSTLGSLSRSPYNGLNTTYAAMIQAAFHPQWWNSSAVVGGFTVMENNFSLYWGLAINLYESTLVSGETRYDAYLSGNTGALTAQEKLGLDVFTGKGRCVGCHSGAALTEATTATGDSNAGFINSGVRPSAEDGGDIVQGGGRFKTPGLRNVELTGPYFHNGELLTLRQVVDFYNRGGDFREAATDSDIRPLGLSSAEKDALVAVMLAMTDERVRFERQPFDHPSLYVPNGPNLPAVGAAGRGTPLAPFLNVNHFVP